MARTYNTTTLQSLLTITSDNNYTNLKNDDSVVLDLDALTFDDTTDGSPVAFNQGLTLAAGKAITGAGAVQIGVPSGAYDLTLKMGDAAGAQKVSFLDSGDVEVGRVDSDGNAQFDGDMSIGGNLVVQGSKTFVQGETTAFADKHLFINDAYTTASAVTGGLVVNYLPTSTTDTVNGVFTAGVDGVSDPTVVTTGSATFSQHDLILITGSTDNTNDGVYEVHDHTDTTLTIRSTAYGVTDQLEDWTGNQFTSGSQGTPAIVKIGVSILRAGTDGAWETASGNSTGASGLTFTDLATAAGTTLTTAYQAGATLTTDSGNGDVIIAGTENLRFNDSIGAVFGSGSDVTIRWDGTDIDVLALADLTSWKWGVNDDHGFTMEWRTSTSGMYHSISDGILGCYGGAGITGDDLGFLVLGSDGDFQLNFDGTTVYMFTDDFAVGGDGPNLQLYTGSGSTGNDGGDLTITTGSGGVSSGAAAAGAGGALAISVGNGGGAATGYNGAAGPAITIIGGEGGASVTGQTGGKGTNITINAGRGGRDDAGGTEGEGGDLTMDAGRGNAAGDIEIGTNYCSALTLAKSTTTTTINGAAITLSSAGDLHLLATGEVTTNVRPNATTGGVTAGNVAYQLTAGTMGHADASAASTAGVLGIAANTASAGNPVQIAGIYGTVVTVNSDLSGDTVNDIVYLSETPGLVTTTAPTTVGAVVFEVGRIHTAGTAGNARIWFQPRYVSVVS